MTFIGDYAYSHPFVFAFVRSVRHPTREREEDFIGQYNNAKERRTEECERDTSKTITKVIICIE